MSNISALDIHTRSDQEKVLSEIDILLDSIYRKDGIDKALSENVRHSTASIISPLLKEGNAEDVLKQLKQEIKDLAVVEIVLAFEPGVAFMGEVQNLLSKKIGKEAILDVRYDKSILGGAQIINDGYYHDYTMKRIMNEHLKNVTNQE